MWWMTTKWSLKPSMSGPQFSVLSIVTTLSFLWQVLSCSVSLQILDNSLCHVSHLVSHHHHVWVLPSLLPSHPLLVATDQVPPAHPPPDPVYCQNISDSALFTLLLFIQYTFRLRFPPLVSIPTLAWVWCCNAGWHRDNEADWPAGTSIQMRRGVRGVASTMSITRIQYSAKPGNLTPPTFSRQIRNLTSGHPVILGDQRLRVFKMFNEICEILRMSCELCRL